MPDQPHLAVRGWPISIAWTKTTIHRNPHWISGILAQASEVEQGSSPPSSDSGASLGRWVTTSAPTSRAIWNAPTEEACATVSTPVRHPHACRSHYSRSAVAQPRTPHARSRSGHDYASPAAAMACALARAIVRYTVERPTCSNSASSVLVCSPSLPGTELERRAGQHRTALVRASRVPGGRHGRRLAHDAAAPLTIPLRKLLSRPVLRS